MSEPDGKYTLEYHTADDPDPQGPPFKYRTHYPAEALAEAWRHRHSGGRALRITRDGREVLDRARLDAALARLSELLPPDPEEVLLKTCERVLKERADVH